MTGRQDKLDDPSAWRRISLAQLVAETKARNRAIVEAGLREMDAMVDAQAAQIERDLGEITQQ